MIVNEGHLREIRKRLGIDDSKFLLKYVASSTTRNTNESYETMLVGLQSVRVVGFGVLYLSPCFSAGGEWAFLFLFRDSCSGLEVIQVLPAMK